MVRKPFLYERTALANERTLLAYIRTALTLFVVGVTFLHFLDGRPSIHFFGWFFIILAVCLLSIGLWRFTKVKRMIQSSEKRAPMSKNGAKDF